ncbi:MAG: cysteine desulfurase family protein [Antricoccus sp.]
MLEVYLDHAATTTIRGEVIEVVSRVMRDTGNASSLHNAGRQARRIVEEAREQVAYAVGADPIEIIFTSGATEANNIAIQGMFQIANDGDQTPLSILTSAGEHHSVLDPIRYLADKSGALIQWVQLSPDGAVSETTLASALAVVDPPIALASLMWVNNETGAISDIRALARLCQDRKIPLHTDAVQAWSIIDLDFRSSGASTMALSGHKIGGPQGIGALVAKRSFGPDPLIHGGGQERRIRSGTLDVATIAGFGVAAQSMVRDRSADTIRRSALRRRLASGIVSSVPEAILNGPPLTPTDHVVPGIVNVTFPGVRAETLLMVLDGRGIYVSTGSACTAGVAEPSHVILAMTGDEHLASQSLRLSLGRTTDEADIDHVLGEIADAVDMARAASI